MHTQFGHCPRQVLIQILKQSKATDDFVEAAKKFRCESCALNTVAPQTSKVSKPKEYGFNNDVGPDVFELHDHAGGRYSGS